MENFANSLLFSMQSELQRISARSAPKYATIARISRLCLDKPDCRERTSRRQRGDRPAFSPEGICAVRFQRRASEGVRRMQCDQKSMMWRSPLDSLLRNSLPLCCRLSRESSAGWKSAVEGMHATEERFVLTLNPEKNSSRHEFRPRWPTCRSLAKHKSDSAPPCSQKHPQFPGAICARSAA